MKKSWIKISLFLCMGLAVASAMAIGGFRKNQPTQDKSQEPRTYKPEHVTIPPYVQSKIKNLEIVKVILINQGSTAAGLAIDVMNNRDQAVVALDFVSGDATFTGLRIDGLLQEGKQLVVIPPHSSKTFKWGLGEVIENETVFLAAAVFADGAEEGDKRSLDGIKIYRQKFQEKERERKAKKGVQQ